MIIWWWSFEQALWLLKIGYIVDQSHWYMEHGSSVFLSLDSSTDLEVFIKTNTMETKNSANKDEERCEFY